MKSNPTARIDPSVALLASFVYFVQGAIAIAAVAFPLYLRHQGWGISEITTFSFVTALPWTLKLLFGAFSDGLPLFRLRRKPYLILSSLLAVSAWLGFAFLPSRVEVLYFLALVENFGFAVTDVVTDAIIVEHSSDSTSQLYQSLAWGFRSLGAILGGVLGGWLAQHVSFHWVFGFTATLPLTTLAVTFFLEEVPPRGGERPRNVVTPILESLRAILKNDLKWFALFLIMTSFSGAFNTPFFFFLKETLGFSESFLGALSSLTWVGAIGGCAFYGKTLKNLPLKKALQLAVWLGVVNALSTYGILNRPSAMVLFLGGGFLGYLSLLPLMAAAAVLSRQKGIEGSLFALVMSVFNLGQILATFIGGRLFDIIGLKALIFVSAALSLTSLFAVARLKSLEG